LLRHGSKNKFRDHFGDLLHSEQRALNVSTDLQLVRLTNLARYRIQSAKKGGKAANCREPHRSEQVDWSTMNDDKKALSIYFCSLVSFPNFYARILSRTNTFVRGFFCFPSRFCCFCLPRPRLREMKEFSGVFLPGNKSLGSAQKGY
jgi:hypothetical protein